MTDSPTFEKPVDKRPFWKKKRVWIPSVVVVLLIAISLSNKEDTKDEFNAAVSSTTTASNNGDNKQETTTTAKKNDPDISMDEFNKLTTGMTYNEAVAVIGGPGEVSSDSEIAGIKTTLYTWKGEKGFGANANATFQDSKLASKAQFGLK